MQAIDSRARLRGRRLAKSANAAISSKDRHEIKRKCAWRGALRFAFVLKMATIAKLLGVRSAFHVRLRCDHR
ncbi:MAG: hypothetical protein PPHEINF_2173 [uncultured Paraburkholderia sp.]|nr:MAG: hypothetical protein PPHEINF_2173 [uncultured Paraburkholderia sp.]